MFLLFLNFCIISLADGEFCDPALFHHLEQKSNTFNTVSSLKGGSAHAIFMAAITLLQLRGGEM